MMANRIIQFLLLLFFVLSSTACLSQVTDSTAADSVLLKQIEEQMKTDNNNVPPPAARSGISSNPDIGVIGDFRASYVSRGKKNLDAYLNETEMSLQAAVDPYLRADFFISFARNPETGEYGVEVEEGYLTTLNLPAKLQLRLGKFREALGRINPMHPHALPFIDMPNAYVNYFGEEGLNDEGASLSWLIPNKKFYQELILQVTTGRGESPSFKRADNNHLLYLAHLKNFFTLSDNATLELGLSGVTGPNDSARTTSIGAADITYKWKPVKMNTYRSFTWQTEIFFASEGLAPNDTRKSFGLYSFMTYQLAKRWFLTGRYDYAQQPHYSSIAENAFSLTAGWYATEFSKLEVEAKATKPDLESTYMQAWLRWIFVIGAHGAHQY
jgi:hypothetical protein